MKEFDLVRLQPETLLKINSFIDMNQRLQRRIHRNLPHSFNLFGKCRQLFIFGHLFFSAPCVGPRPLGPIKFSSAVFDFLPVCVIKYLCAALIKHNCEFSIHKYQ